MLLGAKIINYPFWQSHVVDGRTVDPEMVDRDVCAFHEMIEEERRGFSQLAVDTAKAVAATGNDVRWIKLSAYALIVFALSFIASVWGIFYPHMITLSDRVSKLEITAMTNLKMIQYQERVDEESRADRKEIRKAIEELRKLVEDTHREAMKR